MTYTLNFAFYLLVLGDGTPPVSHQCSQSDLQSFPVPGPTSSSRPRAAGSGSRESGIPEVTGKSCGAHWPLGASAVRPLLPPSIGLSVQGSHKPLFDRMESRLVRLAEVSQSPRPEVDPRPRPEAPEAQT